MDFNAHDYNERMAKRIFRKVYPLIATQIVARTGLTRGRCLDLGGGSGMLGIRLAERTDLRVVVCDPDPAFVVLAGENIAEAGLPDRVTAIRAAAEDLPFADKSFDLVASRDSIFFWRDQGRGLAEAWRVLQPDGWAYIGGGTGSAELATEVAAERAREMDLPDPYFRKFPPAHFVALLDRLGIMGAVIADAAGMWIVAHKAKALGTACDG